MMKINILLPDCMEMWFDGIRNMSTRDAVGIMESLDVFNIEGDAFTYFNYNNFKEEVVIDDLKFICGTNDIASLMINGYAKLYAV